MKKAPYILLFAIAAQAGTLTQVNTRAALGGNDLIDWTLLGPTTTVVPNPFTVHSDGGISVAVSQPGGASNPFVRFDQPTNWIGNFQDGDALLFTGATFNGNGMGPITLTFSDAIMAFGFQIQTNHQGAFNATLTAFGAGSVNFGSVSVDGNSNGAADNSAVFLGLTSSLEDITSVVITVNTNNDLGFAINRPDILNPIRASLTPEPAAFGFIAPAVAILWSARRRLLAP